MKIRNFSRWVFVVALMVPPSALAKASQHPVQEKPAATINKPIPVVTTLSVIAALVKEIGGDRVSVTSLTESAEDPHFVKAKPTFKRWVSDASLFFQIGRSLELWVPQVIAASANEKLAGANLVSVSNGMKALEVPSKLTRDKGDIHPQGNPHIWLSALGGLRMAENIKAALIAVDSSHKATYEKNFVGFKDRLSKALFGEELVKAAGDVDMLWRLHEGKKLKDYVASKKKPLGGWLQIASSIDYPFITYHSVWSYLVDEFDLPFFAAIEEKSGVQPTKKFINDLVNRAKERGVKRVFDARYYVGNSGVMNMVAGEIGGKNTFIDADCLPGETFVGMMDRIFKTLVELRPMATPAAKPQAQPITPDAKPKAVPADDATRAPKK